MDVGTRSSTPRRLREDLRTTRGDTERTAATLVLTNQGHRTFHGVSERLAERFSPALQAVDKVQETASAFHGIARIEHPK